MSLTKSLEIILVVFEDLPVDQVKDFKTEIEEFKKHVWAKYFECMKNSEEEI